MSRSRLDHRTRRFGPLLPLGVLLIVFSLVLAACAAPTGEDDPEPAPTTAPAPDDDGPDEDPGPPDEPDEPLIDQLVIDAGFVHSFGDPHRDNSTGGRMIFRAVYDTLTTFATADISEVNPWLATSWEPNADATEWTFHLREDVMFSDGTPLTSDDVVFSLQRLHNLKSPAAWMVEGWDVSAPDDYTVVVRVPRPMPELPSIATNPTLAIVNRAEVERQGGNADPDADQTDQAAAWFDENSAGSGRYIVERFSTVDEIVLVRNENHWNPPAVRRLVLRNVEPAAQRLNLISGESQVALELTDDALSGLEDFNIVRTQGSSIFYLQANTDPAVSEVTSSPDFWEAVRYAIDYERLLEIAGEGAVQPCGVLVVQVLGALPRDECVTRDLDRARAAVERGGFGDTPIEIEFPADVEQEGMEFSVVAQRVQPMLQEAGLNVELRSTPFSVAIERLRDAAPQVLVWSIGIRFPDPAAYLVFAPGGSNAITVNWMEGDSSEIEAVADRARRAITDEEREPIYREFQELMNEQSPYIPLFQMGRIVVADPSLQNVVPHPTFVFDLAALR